MSHVVVLSHRDTSDIQQVFGPFNTPELAAQVLEELRTWPTLQGLWAVKPVTPIPGRAVQRPLPAPGFTGATPSAAIIPVANQWIDTTTHLTSRWPAPTPSEAAPAPAARTAEPLHPPGKPPVAKTPVAALNTYRVTVAHPRDRKQPVITDVAAHHFDADQHAGGWVTFHDADGVCVFAASDIACRQVELVARRNVLTIPAECAGLLVMALEGYRASDSDTAQQLDALLAALRGHQGERRAPAEPCPNTP